MIPSQTSWDLFTISFRVVRTRTAEHFSLVGDDHRIMWEIPSGTTLKCITNQTEKFSYSLENHRFLDLQMSLVSLLIFRWHVIYS